MLRQWKAGALLLAVALLTAGGLTLYMSGRGSFVSKLWTEAQSRNISRELFDLALGAFQPDPDVLDLARNQPEVLSTVEEYVNRRVSPRRIETGRLKAVEWKEAVAGIEKKYGVPADILIAIWGIESNFGKSMGDRNVVVSLATLSKAGYRSDYFGGELLAALEMLRDGKIEQDKMVGSWAGAMGQIQFMPSSYIAYAVDYDGDGRRDIWSSVPDSLASTANYLKRSGWQPSRDWGYEVKLPDGFDFAAAWKKKSISLRDWAKMGIKRADGTPFPRPEEKARFFLPSGGAGPAFLVLKNFDVIKRYNNADTYALAVAHLADRIAGGDKFIRDWPPDVMPLSREERRELEALIVAQGFKTGKPNGHLNQAVRLAIIRFQKKQGLLADGHPSQALLQRLRTASADSSG